MNDFKKIRKRKLIINLYESQFNLLSNNFFLILMLSSHFSNQNTVKFCEFAKNFF
jgi:hypothetical protein